MPRHQAVFIQEVGAAVKLVPLQHIGAPRHDIYPIGFGQGGEGGEENLLEAGGKFIQQL